MEKVIVDGKLIPGLDVKLQQRDKSSLILVLVWFPERDYCNSNTEKLRSTDLKLYLVDQLSCRRGVVPCTFCLVAPRMQECVVILFIFQKPKHSASVYSIFKARFHPVSTFLSCKTPSLLGSEFLYNLKTE